VKREHAGPRCSVDLIEVPEQSVEVKRLTVLVGTQMCMGIDDRGAVRQEFV